MRRKGSLRLTGHSLFDQNGLENWVIGFIRAQIPKAYIALCAKPGRPSRLRLRRQIGLEGMPDPIVLGDCSTIVTRHGERGGVFVAQAHVPFVGQAGLLLFQPELPADARRPIAKVQESAIVFTIKFAASEAVFVPPLIRSEIALIERYLSAQRDTFAQWDKRLSGLLAVEVAAAWPGLRKRKRRSSG